MENSVSRHDNKQTCAFLRQEWGINMKNSGIGGQAVLEGIMMRNKDKYAIAVRKPDKEIELVVKDSKLLTDKYKWLNYPIIRGIFNFIDSMVTGISTITYSASFYDDPAEQKKTKADEIGRAVFKDKLESILMAVTVIVSVILAVGLFMILPYFVSRLLKNVISSQIFLNFIEGLVRVLIFLLYMVAISQMNDIKRTYMYHGAEHKCINCIENGARLTVENVMNSSRLHKRCGTSFMFLVMFISIVFFIFIRVDNTILQVIIRIFMIPVIAGVSYEILKWAGRNDNAFVNIVSKPGMLLQKLTTKEPDADMVEVAIKAVEAVFDWQEFLDAYYENETDKEAAIQACEDALKQKAQVMDIKISKETGFVTASKDKPEEDINMKEENADTSVYANHIDEDIEEFEFDGHADIEFEDLDSESSHGLSQNQEDFEPLEKDIEMDSLYDEQEDDGESEDVFEGFEFEEPQPEVVDELVADEVPLFKERKTDK